jgi:hypothetical protein
MQDGLAPEAATPGAHWALAVAAQAISISANTLLVAVAGVMRGTGISTLPYSPSALFGLQLWTVVCSTLRSGGRRLGMAFE